MVKIFRLTNYLQEEEIRLEALLGKEKIAPANPVSNASLSPSDPWKGLMLVQKTNEWYFKIYFSLLIAAFVATVVVAFIYRNEIGGLSAVLGVGGVVQGGVVLRLSAEWKEKARVDIVAALAKALPPEDLLSILKALLDGIKK